MITQNPNHRLAAIGVLCSLFVSSLIAADAPKLLPFQGRLTDQNGDVVADGAKVVQFKIYNAPVGGQAVWNGEVQKLTVNGGLVNTMLGSKASLGNVDFNLNLYLELTVDANNDGQITLADPPLLPRQSILPAVFAKEASNARESRKLSGYDWNEMLGISTPADGIPGSRIANGTIDDSKLVPAGVFLSSPAMDEGIGTSPVGPPATSYPMTYNEWNPVSPNLEVTVVSTGRPMWIGLIGGSPSIHTNVPLSSAWMYMHFGPAASPSSVRLRIVNVTNDQMLVDTIYSHPSGGGVYLDYQRCASIVVLPPGTHRLRLVYNAMRPVGDPEQGKDYIWFNYVALGAFRL